MRVSSDVEAVYDLLDRSLDQLEGPYRRRINQYLTESWAGEHPEWSITRLPLLACEAAGGECEQALPVAAAWRTLHLAGDLFDDVEDDLLARRAPPGHGVLANIATGLLVVSQAILFELPVTLQQHIVPRFQQTVLQMASGQHMDLCHRTELTLAEYQEVMRAKSGAFFALGLTAGALAGGAREVSTFESIGMALGLLIQISDDDAGIRRPLNESDISLGVYSLPVLYALEVVPRPTRARLHELMEQAPGSLSAAAAARDIVVKSGCEHYLFAQRLLYHRQLQEALLALNSERFNHLLQWLNKLCSRLELPPLALSLS